MTRRPQSSTDRTRLKMARAVLARDAARRRYPARVDASAAARRPPDDGSSEPSHARGGHLLDALRASSNPRNAVGPLTIGEGAYPTLDTHHPDPAHPRHAQHRRSRLDAGPTPRLAEHPPRVPEALPPSPL